MTIAAKPYLNAEAVNLEVEITKAHVFSENCLEKHTNATTKRLCFLSSNLYYAFFFLF